MYERNFNKNNIPLNINKRKYPFSAIRNPVYNNNFFSNPNSHKIPSINNTNRNSNSHSNSNTNNNSNIIIMSNSNSKNVPIKIHSKPSSGIIQSTIKPPLIINEKQSNAVAHNKPNSSRKKNFINQMNQMISHNKFQSGNGLIYPPLHNFKAIPRNPFKNTQITSIKNIEFQEHKPNANANANANPNINQNNVYLTKEYNSSAKSVSEYAYNEDINADHRKTMEDFHKIIDGFCNDNTKGLFSIYDGHGGTEPIKYIKDRLPEIFSQFLYDTNFNVEKSFIYGFQKIDDEIKCFSETENVGCTATVVFIFKEYDTIHGNRRVLYCANVGDSKSVLIRNEEVVVLTTDHKCSNAEEVERIKGMGGIVFNSRLYGQLALSRALGDHSMKNNGLICTPTIHKRYIEDKDNYIIIASDGIWDTVSDDDLIKLSSSSALSSFQVDSKDIENNTDSNKQKEKDNTKDKEITAESLCTSIIEKAIEKGSYDNISCIAIKI